MAYRQYQKFQLNCPIVFRGPNGAAAGVAAQHSQDFTVWYAHCPGLKVSLVFLLFSFFISAFYPFSFLI